MLGLADYSVREVNAFLDDIEIGDAIVTPDEGTRAAWFGIVLSDCFPSSDVCELY